MSDQVKEGDKVSWSWGASDPSGTVGEVKDGKVTVTSHRGNDISKTGDANDPAVHIERSGNDVVKLASELNVDKPAAGEPSKQKDDKEDKEDKPEKKEKNGDKSEGKPAEHVEDASNKDKPKADEPKAGDKRKADDKADAADGKDGVDKGGVDHKEKDDDKSDDDKPPKKQQKSNGDEAGEKKGRGRPPKNAANGEANGSASQGKPPAKAKKDKKQPTVGKAQRQTRSQGGV